MLGSGDTFKFRVFLRCYELRSGKFHLNQIYERSDPKEFEESQNANERVWLISEEDTFRIYGCRWNMRIVPDTGCQIEDRYMWMYEGMDHSTGMPVSLDTPFDIPPLPPKFAVRGLLRAGHHIFKQFHSPF